MGRLIRLPVQLVLSLFAVVWTVKSCTLALLILVPTKQWSGWVLRRIGGQFWSQTLLRVVSKGLEVEPPPGGIWPGRAIYIANHTSQLDINAIFASIPHPVIFLSKASVRNVPFLGWANARVGTVFVERGQVESAVKAASDLRQRLDEGKVVFVFPEGTRSATGELLPFKKGAFRLAVDAGVPIVPLWISGTRDALPKGGFLIRRKAIRVKFGAPIEPGSTGVDALSDQAREALLALSAT